VLSARLGYDVKIDCDEYFDAPLAREWRREN
jgi:hypothetical protein